jgi:phosphomevalonate kinase
MTRVASAPGKILLAGEYAVLEGSVAVVMAVKRRARATIGEPARRSPFLAAAAAALAAELGPDSAAARAADAVVVDTGALCAPSGEKLGLGSSAAATTAALAACLAADRVLEPVLDRVLLHRLAHRAHGDAQAGIDPAARGSGADIAASVWGGLLALRPRGAAGPPAVAPLSLPAGLELVAVWTGRPADTRVLVAAIRALAERDPAAYRLCMDSIAAAAESLLAACLEGDAGRAVAAVGAGGDAVGELGRATRAELVLDAHRRLAAEAARLGGAFKPTGAAGGDIALAAFADHNAAQQFRAHATRHGMTVLDSSVEAAGALVEDDSP